MANLLAGTWSPQQSSSPQDRVGWDLVFGSLPRWWQPHAGPRLTRQTAQEKARRDPVGSGTGVSPRQDPPWFEKGVQPGAFTEAAHCAAFSYPAWHHKVPVGAWFA